MAKQSFPQNKLINSIQQYLENIGIRTEFIKQELDFKALHKQYTVHFNELAKDLEIGWDKFLETDLDFSFEVLHLEQTDYQLYFEPPYHFNRYRLKTLKNSFYKDIPFFDLKKWQIYCRSREKEALKAGLTKKAWATPLAEKLLGSAEEPGYFGGNGSPGWKLHAIANFCLDLHQHHQKSKFLRLTAYDGFMVQGKIELLGDSLKLKEYEKAIQQVISRQIGYEIPSPETEEEKNPE